MLCQRRCRQKAENTHHSQTSRIIKTSRMSFCNLRTLLKKREILLYFGIINSLLIMSAQGQNKNTNECPPSITKNPATEITYKVNKGVTLECESSGDPEYIWKKNGKVVSVNRISGMLRYATANESMEGVYQCFAKNSLGTAISTKSLVKKAELISFPTRNVKINEPLLGQPLTLRCNPPRCYPKGFVYWSEEGEDQKLKAIENTPRISLDYDGNLHFANVVKADHRDDRKYVCIISNDALRSNMQGDDQQIRPVSVKGGPVPTPPQLLWSYPTGTKLVVARHKALRMKCIFSGFPTPNVTWERHVNADNPRQLHFPNDGFGQEIVIENVTEEDSGRYHCSATNGVVGPSASRSFTVEVQSAPYWRTTPPENVEVSEDGDATFSCFADGIPKPEILWSLDGEPLHGLHPDERRQANATHLVFKNLVKSDSKVIQCLAENQHGSLLANAHLYVKAEPPMLMVVFGNEVKAAEGRDVMLNCSAVGFPSPVFHWSKNNTPIEASLFDRFVMLENGSLLIKAVSLSDDDVYKCSAQNKFGVEDTSGLFIVLKKTTIEVPPTSQNVLAKSKVILECLSKTDPEEMENLQVNWSKNGNPVNPATSSGRVIHDSNNSLIIKEAQVLDSGSYTCKAFTPLDSEEFSATVIVRDRPDPPINLKLTPRCSGPNTTLSWQPGNNGNEEITQYVVRYESSLNESGSINVISGSGPLEALVSLKPNRKYAFSVTAQNVLGSSDRALFSADGCVTPPLTPSKNPEGVCSEMRGSGRLVIVWRALTVYELNGPGFRYIVTYRRLDRPEAEEDRLAITDWMAKELVIYDLEEFVPYEISVQSANDVGLAPVEAERRLARSSEGTPVVSPQNFRINLEKLNSSGVEFQWDAVDETLELIKGYFRGYQVQFWRSGKSDTKQLIDIKINREFDFCPLKKNRNRREAATRTMVSAFATNLWPFSQITAGVAVMNGAKVGNLSNTITFHTPEGVPGPVTNLRTTEVGSFHVKLHWGPPLNPSGVITGYVIRYIVAYPMNGSFEEKNITDPSKPYGKLHPLRDDSAYNITVYAKTSIGLGEPVSLQIKTFIIAPPDKPFISLSDVGKTSVNISWLVSKEKAVNPGSEFYVEYRRLGDEASDWQTASPAEGDDHWLNVSDLETGIEYEFAVVAVNLVNLTRSNKVTYKTGEQQSQPRVSAGQSLWFIPLIVLLIVIIIVIIFLVYKQLNKGETYVVAEKEIFGKAVAEEESGFGEYFRRPDINHVGNRSSIISQPLSELSDDRSLSEYGDPDVQNFNEDGSFIGRYVNRDSTANRTNPQVYT